MQPLSIWPSPRLMGRFRAQVSVLGKATAPLEELGCSELGEKSQKSQNKVYEIIAVDSHVFRNQCPSSSSIIGPKLQILRSSDELPTPCFNTNALGQHTPPRQRTCTTLAPSCLSTLSRMDLFVRKTCSNDLQMTIIFLLHP